MKRLLLIAIVILVLVTTAVIFAAPHGPHVYEPSPIAASALPLTSSATTTPATSTPPPIPAKPIGISPALSVTPKIILQGDPVMITLTNIGSTNVASASLSTPGNDAAALHFTSYKSNLISFYGSSISQKVGTATVQVTLQNGTHVSQPFAITARTQPSEDLPVPAQLGGNSTSSQQALVSNLETENVELANVYSNPTTAFWTSTFAFPVKPPIVVTDPYGYDRESGAETIVHKGTDFHAPPGTPVYAINDGIVRLTKLFTVYGNTIIIDHGLGIQSFSMHLSSMSVSAGERVTKGELIGYSGETGYAEGPHLHLTIRVTGQSIDPMKFYALFGVTP